MPAKGTRYNKCGFLTVDEIKKMRLQRKSWEVIRGFCQVSASSLSKCIKRYGLSDQRAYSYERRERKSNLAERLAKRDGYNKLSDAIRDLRLNKRMTYEEVVKHFDGHIDAVRRNYPSDIVGKVFIKTQKLLDHAMRQCEVNNQKGRQRTWAKMNDAMLTKRNR